MSLNGMHRAGTSPMQLIFGKIIIIIIIIIIFFFYYYKLKVENEIEKAHFETSSLIFCWLIRWLVWKLSWVQGMSQEETETIHCVRNFQYKACHKIK